MARGVLGRIGSASWARPSRTSLIALVVAIVALATATVSAWRWATAVPDPARTIISAASLLSQPVRLESSLDAAWRYALEGARDLDGAWEPLLAPALPPAMCPNPDPDQPLGQAIAALDDEIRRGATREVVQRRIGELRRVASVTPGSIDELLIRYNLARAYLAAGDAAAAAQALEPVFDGFLNGDRLPVANLAAAERLVGAGNVSRSDAALGFHARFLAGAIAYTRAEPFTAIKHFRLTINALNYLIAAHATDRLTTAGHYQRIPVSLETYGCGRSGDPITSLDAYAGLVAAYLAAPEFRDPSRLGPEVQRTRLEIDPDDPFRPVLMHAASSAGRGSPIPENVLWAASNLQRVYHYNRLAPDPRLEVTRAVVLLHLTSNAEWVDAMTANGAAAVCGMLRGIAEQLHRAASAHAVTATSASRADSARAAAGIHVWARLNAGCADWELPRLEADVRSGWIRRGGALAGGSVPALYEAWRIELERALARGGSGIARLEPLLRRIRSHRAAFADGRVPADLPAQTDPRRGHRFVEAWWNGVHADLARALVDEAVADKPTIAAGRAPELLATLNAAVRHGGGRPSDVYAPSDLATLARSGGNSRYVAYRIRYAALDHPVAFGILLGLGFTVLTSVLIAGFISFWRYDLLLDRRLYATESASRRLR